MRVEIDDLNKVKDPDRFKYKVYSVGSKIHYRGNAYIATINASEANKIIKQEKENDPHNKGDRKGWEPVSESDFYDELSDTEGLLENTIQYYG